MYRFRVRVEHDKGETTFKVVADSMAEAIQRIMTVENCPENAIVMIKRMK